MEDKYELSIWNHINFHMFYELYDSYNRKQEDIRVSELIERVNNKVGGNPSISDFYEFVNPGTILSLLYTNLVVPREIFVNEEFGNKFFEKFEVDFADYFIIEFKEDYVDTKFKFIKMLRNAVSHANFEWLDNKSTLKLWNTYREQKNFVVKCNLTNLTYFALKVSEFIASNRTQLKFLK